jgi:hypothetical protein
LCTAVALVVFSAVVSAAPSNRPVVYVGPVKATGVARDTALTLATSLSSALAERITPDLELTDAEREKNIMELTQQAVMIGEATDIEEPVDVCAGGCVCRASLAPRVRYFVHVEVTQLKNAQLEVLTWLEEKGGKQLGVPLKIKAKDVFAAVDQMPSLAGGVLQALKDVRGLKR